MARIGLIHGGATWQLEPWQAVMVDDLNLDLLYIDTYRTSRFSEKYCDIIIVPWAPDKIFLLNNYFNFASFLRRGGVLLAFGEFEGDWLPNTTWSKARGNEVKINDLSKVKYSDHIQLSAKKILSNLKEADFLNWGDTYHGFFKNPPINSCTLVTNESSSCVMFMDCDSYKGSILATTMDPDFHAYNGITSAKILITNCVQWALAESKSIGGTRTIFTLPSRKDISMLLKSPRFMGIVRDVIITIGYTITSFILIKFIT